jgi:starvation-inducible DNA-binding protein
MSDLGQSLKVVLADTFTEYMMAHGYHWNTEGRFFASDHIFFQKIYEELWESVDDIAEHIRALDEYAPFSYKRFQELTTIEDDNKIPTAKIMIERLLAANDKTIASVKAAIQQAKLASNEGVVNFLGGRQEALDKHGWMLRSSLKQNRE